MANRESRNRLAEHAPVAAELERRLLAWDATLPPPSLPREINAQDQLFFDSHVTKSGVVVVKRGEGKEMPRKAGKRSSNPKEP
jgi:hypothetical protein